MNKQMTQKQVAAKGFAAIAAAGFLMLLLGMFGLGAAQPVWAQMRSNILQKRAISEALFSSPVITL